MKYLFHRSSSLHNNTDKIYNFTASENLKNPTTMILEDVVYRATTRADYLYPQTIYLRSDALTTMLKENHTVEVKSDGSNRSSNIIGVLTQTSFPGRYELRGKYRFKIDPHRTNKIFEFTFTDGDTRLDTIFTGSGTGYDSEFVITLEFN